MQGNGGMGSKLLEEGGTSPPKPMPEVNGSIAVIRSLDEVGADDFGAGEAVESGAVEAGSRLREAGKEVGVVV